MAERKELDFPIDERARGEVRQAVVRGVDATITGRAVAKAGGGGAPSRFARLRGRATAGLTTEQILALTRGEG